ncbi:MAG: co-chaperone GroES [Candidatus Fermentibacteraceae bacterium]|nr:co-chaperone GroES [Candidatus Fermentibacteraceae bacterium]
MGNSKIQPLFDRVLIKREEPREVVKSGIVIPDTAKEKPLEGIVEAIGQGKRNSEGEGFITPVVKKGDHVLIGKYSGTEVKILDDEYVIVREDDILAILKN